MLLTFDAANPAERESVLDSQRQITIQALENRTHASYRWNLRDDLQDLKCQRLLLFCTITFYVVIRFLRVSKMYETNQRF